MPIRRGGRPALRSWLVKTKTMKSNRHGQSRVLGTDELDLLISNLPEQHHKIVAEICRRTGCRIGEATQLTWGMVSSAATTFPKEVCKGKLAGRQVPMTKPLWAALCAWRSTWIERQGHDPSPADFIVPGRYQGSHMSSRAFMDALKAASLESGLQGVSSHSSRRSALSAGHASGVPMKVLMSLSGHRSLSSISRYLEVTQEQQEEAANCFA